MTDMCVTIDVLEAGRQHSEQVMVLRGFFFWGGGPLARSMGSPNVKC